MSATTLFSLSGAELRASAAADDTAAQAEIARRAAKPAKTVAALRSRGDEAAAKARIEAAKAAKPTAKAKPAKAEKPKAAPAPAFTRATEEVAVVSKRDTIAAVRKDFGGRLDALEKATLGLAALAASQNEVLQTLARAQLARAA